VPGPAPARCVAFRDCTQSVLAAPRWGPAYWSMVYPGEHHPGMHIRAWLPWTRPEGRAGCSLERR